MRKLAFLLALLMLVTSATALAELDTSQPVELVVCFMGEPPTDGSDVLAAANAILKEKFNCTLKIDCLGWADWQTAYNLKIMSQEPVDIIYTAAWASDREYAQKNAFTYLEDYLPTYAPELYELYGEDIWQFCTVQGHIYCIPGYQFTYSGGGIIYREDLREKFDLPVPNTVENWEAYNQGIVDNTDIIPMAQYLTTLGLEDMCLMEYMNSIGDFGVIIGYAQQGEEPSWQDITYYWGSEMQIEDLKLAKDWLDKGFASRNLMSNPVADSINDYLEAGMCVLSNEGNNVDKWMGVVNNLYTDGSDWEVRYVPFDVSMGYAKLAEPTQDACAIPYVSQHKELACAVIQEIFLNPELNRLLRYGIEGVHYTVDPATGALADNVENDNFNAEGFNAWCWRNADLALTSKNEKSYLYDDMVAYLKTMKSYSKLGFTFNTTELETELASIEAVRVAYLEPLLYGLSEDVEADVEIFMQKAKEAGLEKVWDAFEEQWLEYCEENGFE